jgi:hypothetical protein
MVKGEARMIKGDQRVHIRKHKHGTNNFRL